MIPAKTEPTNDEAWRGELRDVITHVDELLTALALTRDDVELTSGREFPLRVPRSFVRRMRRGDPDDPLLRQVLPLSAEDDETAGYVVDPLEETEAIAARGVLQKYQGRVLVLATGACAVHCRYCFRRHFPYDAHRQASGFPGLDVIADDPSISEVILSGGDPLVLTDGHLERLIKRIEAIPHVRRLRLHTRVPVVIPSRSTETLARIFDATRLSVVIVLHANHPNEIDAEVTQRLQALATVPLFNQSVLLRGINDDPGTLIDLSESLFEAGVIPYYLHLPDRVAGTAHFDVPIERAIALHREISAALPGYLVPRLVKETAGADGKSPVSI